VSPNSPSESERARILGAFSASSLEALVRCPYRFLLQRLGVEETELVKDDDARAEGDWLHDVLEAFFTGKAGERRLAGPLDPTVAWENFRAYALDRLTELTETIAPSGPQVEPVLLQLKLKSWPAFVDHLMRLYTPATLARALLGWRERSLTQDDGAAIELALGDRRVKLRGAVDAIERPDGVHVITDYKRAGTPPKAEILSGIAPQLLVYAQAASAMSPELPLSQAVCGYWSILKGSWQEGVAGSAAADAAKKSGLTTGKASATLEDALAHFLDLVDWRLKEVEPAGASFRPDPSACGFCRFAGVCRRDDPETQPALAAGARLTERLAQRSLGEGAS
jgi:RecB family exonuclease